MLYSYEPVAGSQAGGIFYLPDVKDEEKHSVSLSDTAVPYEGGFGSFSYEGNGVTIRTDGTIAAVYSISPDWLLNNDNGAYSGNTAGMLAALVDCAQFILDGGDGKLTDKFIGNEVGTTLGLFGATVTSRFCYARVVSYDTTIISRAAGVAEVNVTLKCNTATWTYLPGNVNVPFH